MNRLTASCVKPARGSRVPNISGVIVWATSLRTLSQPAVDGGGVFVCANLTTNLRTVRDLNDSMADSARNESAGKAQTQSDASGPVGLPSFFLRTKLLPPRPAPEMLSRARLIERLHANLKLPVTLVTANAGSGKKTLLAHFLRKPQQPSLPPLLHPTDPYPPCP